MQGSFAERVLEARKARGWTQKELADKASVALRTVQTVESGQSGAPQRATRLSLAKAMPELEVTLDDERESWSGDTSAYVNLMGALLEALPPKQRDEFMREVARLYAEVRRTDT